MKYTIRTEEDRLRIAGLVRNLADGKVFEVTIEPRKEQRSLNQNALYHRWLSFISSETGNDHDSLHKYFARKYLGVTEQNVFGVRVAQVVSTTTLTTEQFTTYLTQIEAEMNSMGILLPQPYERYD